MPSLIQEKNVIGDIVHFELPFHYSRDAETIVSGAGELKIGTVLGRQTADGKFGVYDPEVSNGLETVAGVLLSNVDATSTDVEGALVLTDIATVSQAMLIFGATVDDSTKRQAAIDGLRAIGIKVTQGA